jgi:nucleoid DNA-binding protein
MRKTYGKKYFERRIAKRDTELGRALRLTRKEVGQVLDAYHDEIWRVLLAQKPVQLGAAGRIYLSVRSPVTQELSVMGGEVVDLPQTITLRGKASSALKDAYYDLQGLVYPSDLEK